MRSDRVCASARDIAAGSLQGWLSLRLGFVGPRGLGSGLCLLKASDPLYDGILERLTSRPCETNASLCRWGFGQDLDQDLALNLGRQGSALGCGFSKAEELGPSPETAAEVQMDQLGPGMLSGGIRRSGEQTKETGAAATLAGGPGSAAWLLGRVKAAQPLWGWERAAGREATPGRHLPSWHYPPAALATDIHRVSGLCFSTIGISGS